MTEDEKKVRKLVMELASIAPGPFIRQPSGHFLSENHNFTIKLRISPVYLHKANRNSAFIPTPTKDEKASLIEAYCNSDEAGTTWFISLQNLLNRTPSMKDVTPFVKSNMMKGDHDNYRFYNYTYED